MVNSRGGISGGLTIADALRELEGRGYVEQFRIRDDAKVECGSCGRVLRARDVPIEAARRVEGVSDPADELLVGGLHCPTCGARGTAVLNFGPNAPPAHAEVLRELDDHRRSSGLAERQGGPALVRDTGWLRGPDG